MFKEHGTYTQFKQKGNWALGEKMQKKKELI